MKVVLVIPTYNERENIKPLIEGLEDVFCSCGARPRLAATEGDHPSTPLRASKGRNYTVLFVDDNSPDGTAEVVRSEMERWPNLKLITGQKEGLGAAYLRGIDYAVSQMDAEVIVSMDADLSHNPAYLPRLLDKIDGGADLVLGSRYIKGGSIPKSWSLHRKFLSLAGNLIVRTLLGLWSLHEFTNSLRAFRVDLYRRMDRNKFSFADNTFLPAFVYEAHRTGARVEEIPLEFRNRAAGESKIEVFKYGPNLLRYCLGKFLTRL